eukprot:TRINITY_DN3038_c0_g2_i10.p1 TRINITY_DN3038_c0_g2~~TRINITY_DN3038_c0_g2_i10.p1  ORF type:complete len:239 (-),score=49.98 TRINITY_DN3038_c0_g2_i10:536-1252(-)
MAAFSESLQNNNEVFKVEENKLRKQIERQRSIIEEIRQENEQLALEKVSEATRFSQEKTELKKALAISERTISHLRNEKSALEASQTYLKKRLDKVGHKVYSKETQTEVADGEAKAGVPLESKEFQSRLLQKEEELHMANKHSVVLMNELRHVQERYSQLQELNSELRRSSNDRTKLLEQIEKEKACLMRENIDLKKRREQAMSEITKLNQKVQKKTAKAKAGPKYLSAAVHSLYHKP